MTIDLANILDKNFPRRTLEMAFQRIKISKFSEEGGGGREGLQAPLAGV